MLIDGIYHKGKPIIHLLLTYYCPHYHQ